MQFAQLTRPSAGNAARVILSGLLLSVFLAGCNRPPSPDVMATVNGKQILQADVEKYYKASLGDNPQQPSSEQAKIMHLNILHQMIQDEILQQRATKLNLAASDEDVNAKLTEMKAPYTQEEFDKQLKQRNITVDDLKRDIRRSLTNEKLLNKEIESKINITDSDISGYYNAHKAEFSFIEPMYHLAEIVVTGRDADRRLADAALKVPFIGRTVLRAASADTLPASHPAQAKLAAGPAAGAAGAAFICVGERCSLPVTQPDAIAEVMQAMRSGGAGTADQH